MSETSNRSTLSTPLTSRRPRLNLDSDAVGRYSESIARFFGTGRYLVIQTVIVITWVIINIVFATLRFDPYPFILLNLAFSTQASYAAPLILLAQNRQEDRDRASVLEDRHRATQTKADTEFLARELASVRLSVGENVTRDYLRRELDDIRSTVERLEVLLTAREAERADEREAERETEREIERDDDGRDRGPRSPGGTAEPAG